MKRIIFLLSFLLIFVVDGHSSTRKEIRNKIRYFLNDTLTDNYQLRWTNNSLNEKINTAQLHIVRRTYSIILTTYVTTTANTREYTLPDDFLKARRVSYYRLEGGTTYYVKVDYSDKQSLDRINNWEIGGATIPIRYYIESNLIGIDPKPYSSLVGTNYLKIEYYAKPTSMDSDDDVPFNNLAFLSSYHDLIAYYVCYLCESEKNKEVALTWYDKYWLELKIMVDELSGKPGINPIFPSLK